MQDKPTPDAPTILATIPAGAFDTTLTGGDAPAAPPADDDSLRLPRGGLVALRRSGGIRFTTREVVVYGDGRVAAGVAPVPRGRARYLGEAEMAEVWAALGASDLRRQSPAAGGQGADTYAYEIVARLGGRAYAVEVFDGRIPAPLAPLIALLLRLRPSEG